MSKTEINREYENKHYSNIEKVKRWIEEEYDRILVVVASFYLMNTSKLLLNQKINELFNEATKNVSNRIRKQLSNEWELGNQKNAAYIENFLDAKEGYANDFITGNEKDLDKFLKRKIKGRTFEDRIKIYNKASKKKVLSKVVSYDKGLSSVKISQSLKDELDLQEIIRVARAEIHDAYRMCDQSNWENNPLIVGQEIRVSDIILKHNRCDLCTSQQGIYPKEYVWVKWHLNCMCYKLPIFISPLEYVKLQQSV